LLLPAAALPWSAGAAPPPWPAADWPRAQPAAVGLEPQPLNALVAAVRAGEDGEGAHSLLLVKDGYLVVEEYFGGWRPEALHGLQSVTKSVTSILLGIALDQGALAGAGEPVLRFFPELRPRHADPRWQRLTLAHLLTMRSGTDFADAGAGASLARMNRLRRGWIPFVLGARMTAEPGRRFRYESGGAILLGEVIRRRTGLSLDAFARRYLFAPLGIDHHAWHRAEDGVAHSAGGLDLRPRDLARLGLLYLRGGRWRDRRVVSRRWIERSVARQVPAAGSLAGHPAGYGYLWWILPYPGPARPADFYAAAGHMGQYLFVVPQERLVMVVTAGARDRRAEERPVAWLYDVVLPAVRR